MKTSFLIITLLLSSLQVEIFNGKVVGVSDGDTIIVLNEEKKEIRVRLEAIDCPESKQDFGQRAKQETVNLCFSKEVTIHKTGTDRYGRTLGYVFVGDLCINKELLRKGLAWHYKRYNNDPELSEIEKSARTNKLGIWSQDNPIPPWEFRRKK